MDQENTKGHSTIYLIKLFDLSNYNPVHSLVQYRVQLLQRPSGRRRFDIKISRHRECRFCSPTSGGISSPNLNFRGYCLLPLPFSSVSYSSVLLHTRFFHILFFFYSPIFSMLHVGGLCVICQLPLVSCLFVALLCCQLFVCSPIL